MESQGSGLTRRRGAGGGDASAGGDDGKSSRPTGTPRRDTNGPETAYESSANGHKIAFDPRDISESEERIKQPKLTLMEEVLLLGLKDKQVREEASGSKKQKLCNRRLTIRNRACSHSGTTIYRTLYEDA